MFISGVNNIYSRLHKSLTLQNKKNKRLWQKVQETQGV
nr:MAG TPA: hypothetical protein [Caudoviricetes sp.]